MARLTGCASSSSGTSTGSGSPSGRPHRLDNGRGPLNDELRRSGLLGPEDAKEFLRRGHFAYESGDHGDTWLALELLFAEPRRLQRAASALADRLRGHGAEAVCGPLIGGALFGQWIASELSLRFVYAVREAGTRYAVPRALRSGLSGRRTIVVDDVINAGSATLACVRDVEAAGGRVIAVASLISRVGIRGKLASSLGAPVESLLDLEWSIWSPGECPLCQSRVTLSVAP